MTSKTGNYGNGRDVDAGRGKRVRHAEQYDHGRCGFCDVEPGTAVRRHRGAAMIMFKDVGVDPVPNDTRDVKKGIARWDAYLDVPDPDALAAEFSSRTGEFSE